MVIVIDDYIDENSRPNKNLTNEIWQKIFAFKQDKIIPYENGFKEKMKYQKSKVMIDEYGEFLPDSRTNYQLYCQFINSVLSDIRKGECSYVFFEHQIEQLLHFHLNDLRTEYEDSYWKVWLEGKYEHKR